MTAGGFEIPRRAPLGEDGAATNRRQQHSIASRKPTSPLRIALTAAALTVYLFIVVAYYFKGAAWAGTSPAKPVLRPFTARRTRARGSNPSTNSTCRSRSNAARSRTNSSPRGVMPMPSGLICPRPRHETHLAHPHGVGRNEHTVRATDYVASFDWSAGRGGANLEWKTGFGIVFFQYEHQRVFGLQLDEQGRFKPELSYAYTFNLQEMKSPLIEAVTRAGWNWRPTVWQGPTWLRWLTE
jgi:hypothetical protein